MKKQKHQLSSQPVLWLITLTVAFVILLGQPQKTQAQWTTNGNNINNTNSGNVGVGTTYNYDTLNPSSTSPNINSTYHICSLVKRQTVYAVNASTGADSSTASADAQFYYDQSSLTTRTSISGLCTSITSPAQCDNSSPTSLVARGNMTRTSSWRNTDGAWINTDAAFDIAGNVITVTDPLNHQTSLYYDDNFGAPNGEAETNTAPTELGSLSSYAFLTKATNAQGQTAYAQFDYYMEAAVDGDDINGVVSSGYYNDPLDRPTQVIRSANVNATESQTTFSYNDTGRVITTTSDQASYGDNLLKSELLYDGLGRTTETHSFESSTAYIISKQTYDALGRAKIAYNPYRTTTDTTYGWTESTYDALSRVTKVETFDASSVSTGAVLTSYSSNGVTVTDQAGKARKSVADALGRMSSVYEDPTTGGLNYQTSYSYDVLDNLTTVTQGSQTRSFSYNSLKQLTSATNPESGAVSYQYDNAGNLVLKIDPRGGGTALPNCSIPYNGSNVATCYAYDSLNRPTSRTYNDGTPNVTYAYDTTGISYSKGRLTSLSSSVSTTSYGGFDAMGRVTSSSQATNSQTYSFSYTYDRAGEMKSEVYPSGRVVQTSYDQAGRISKVEVPNVKVYMDSFSYTAQGAVASVRLGNNLWEHENFNSRLQTVEIGLGTTSTDSSTLKLNYGYGSTSNNGNVQTQTITLPNLTLAQSYGYDSLNRLQTAQEMNGGSQTWKQTYVYDRYVNRSFDASNTTIPSPLTNLVINQANNRIDSSAQGQGNTLYDNAGNLTRDLSGNTYSYDAENHQTQLNGGDTSIGASYLYDRDGRRVKKVVGTSTTVFVYDAEGKLIAEYSDSTRV